MRRWAIVYDAGPTLGQRLVLAWQVSTGFFCITGILGDRVMLVDGARMKVFGKGGSVHGLWGD